MLIHTYHHQLNGLETWEMSEVPAFDELLLSWSASLPPKGSIAFFISIKADTWSEEALYAVWGASQQHGGNIRTNKMRIFQDTVDVLDEGKAIGFRVRLEVRDGATLSIVRAVHVCTTNTSKISTETPTQLPSVSLNVPLTSQMMLKHPRSCDLCSPTSTTAAINFLRKDHPINPISFAEKIHDEAFDIYGNWVLNTAHAAATLGKPWYCWVQRLKNFAELHRQLQRKTPVVVSIKGPLEGAPLSYSNGHLIVVKGYDADKTSVICMDPAFPTDAETHVNYPLQAFMEAWGRRRHLAYIFSHFNEL